MKTHECTISDLADDFDQLMFDRNITPPKPKSKGFTIGDGKKLYWYISPCPRTGTYRCFSNEPDGTLGYPRYITSDQKVKIHYD